MNVKQQYFSNITIYRYIRDRDHLFRLIFDLGETEREMGTRTYRIGSMYSAWFILAAEKPTDCHYWVDEKKIRRKVQSEMKKHGVSSEKATPSESITSHTPNTVIKG